jgi:hypothetical protein
MFDETILLFLTIHFVADFYLQTGKLAQKKESSDQGRFPWKYWGIHCAIYALCMLLPSLLSWFDIRFLYMGLILGGCHAFVDWIKSFLYSRNIVKDGTVLRGATFFVDQALHLIPLFLLCYLFPTGFVVVDHFDFVGWIKGFDPLLKWISAFAIIMTPGNIFFKNFCLCLGIKKPENNSTDNLAALAEEPTPKADDYDIKNGGAIIGSLERSVILISLVTKQYLLIPVVLTCKGFARFDRLHEKSFAEFFLIGTLFSILYSFFIFWLIFFPSLSNL